MESMSIEIVNPKAKTLLLNLASMNLINIKKQPPSSAELQSIQRGLDDFQQGRVISHTQVKKRYEKWL